MTTEDLQEISAFILSRYGQLKDEKLIQLATTELMSHNHGLVSALLPVITRKLANAVFSGHIENLPMGIRNFYIETSDATECHLCLLRFEGVAQVLHPPLVTLASRINSTVLVRDPNDEQLFVDPVDWLLPVISMRRTHQDGRLSDVVSINDVPVQTITIHYWRRNQCP